MILVYDRHHNLLDEIVDYNGLSYTWTLNGMGKCQFNVPIESPKASPKNLNWYNHIEIYEKGKKVWGGILIRRKFGSVIQISCLGYAALLYQRRLREKTYPNQTYGELLQQIIEETNAIYDTGISIGIIEAGSLKTQRKVSNTDMVLDKITEFCADVNYDFEVDCDRKFNFYLRKGEDKPNYMLEFGGEADNIIADPGLDQSAMELANSVYSEVDVDGTSRLTSLAQDEESIVLYGLKEGQYSANEGIALQDTLDNYVRGELIRRAYPANTITLQAVDSSLCPFDDIEVGDRITMSLPLYFGFRQPARIIEMTHYADNNVRDITVGNTLARPAKPEIKLYKK